MPSDQDCRAVILTCVDFRFVGWLDEFLHAEGLMGAADVIAWPGGGAALALAGGDVIGDALALSLRLHGPEEMILAAHEECGRLKDAEGQGSMGPHELLLAAGAGARSRFPDTKVRLVMLNLDGSSHWL
jgi:hypothetical protein